MNAKQKEREERARKAVSVFRAMQPGLTGYVRALTGNKSMTVKITEQGGFTDGKHIYVKPPIALGDMTSHQRSLCDQRDADTLLQRCGACRIREEVLSTIYHEVAHNAFGTFTPPTEAAKAHAVEAAIREAGTKYAKRIRDSFDKMPDWAKNDYMSLVQIVSPFLPVLINALEDARVDARMFEARKGTRIMFDARTLDVFRRGYEEADGTRTDWRDRKLNSQAIIGMYVLACGYTPDGWFDPRVEEALKDKQLLKFAAEASQSVTAHQTYYLAFKVLARLRELGFCLNPNEPQDEEEQNDVSEDSVQPKSEGSEEGDPNGEGSEQEADPQDGKDASDSGEADSNGSDSSEDAGQSAAPDQDGDPSGDEGAGGTGVESSDDDSAEDVGSRDSDSEGGNDGAGPDGGSEEGDSGEDRPSDSVEGDNEDSGQQGGSPLEGAAGDSASDEAGDGGSFDEPDEDADDSEGAEAEAGDELTDGEGSDRGREDREGSSSDEDDSDETRGSDDSSSDDSESDLGPEGDDLDGVEAIDSGADEGKGGIDSSAPEYGDADQAVEDLHSFTGHDLDGQPEETMENSAADDEAVTVAVIQGLYFETGSVNVRGVRESKYGKTRTDGTEPEAWRDDGGWGARYARQAGIDTDLNIPESTLGPALMEMRRVFADNERAKMERHLRSGRVNQRVLGKRAWVGDDRLFQKKRIPGKRSYAVLLGIDISYSTVGVNIALAKRAAMAQAELLHRAGIDFAVYAHSANNCDENWNQMWLDVYEVKGFDAPWGTVEQKALADLAPVSENLDGHTVEFYRKTIERHPATDKIILYYSDGKMPAANHDEELEVLQREIAYCKRHEITLMGVGIRTDSPRQHGLDTVQVDSDSDTVQVIRHLKNALVRGR